MARKTAEEQVAALEAAQEKAAPEACEARMIEADETPLVDDVTELLPTDESIVEGSDEIEWVATHYIGDTAVQQMNYANGLPYWRMENGKRRRPTKLQPLRPYRPKPNPAYTMWLDRDAFVLCCAALYSPWGRVDDKGYIAERVDDEHARIYLPLKEGGHEVYIVQIPADFEIVGTKTQ